MLANYRDAQETLRGPNDEPGEGDGVILMPPTWNKSYRELERCLTSLYHEHPPLFAHIRERYLATQPFNEIVREVELNHHGNPRLPANSELLCTIRSSHRRATVRLRRWHPWVRKEKLNEGLQYLATEFNHEPYMPLELRAIAA